jgi:translation initiation factor 5B
VLSADVIYRMIDDYKEWVENEKRRDREEKLQKFIYPAKFKILKGFVFRASNPAVVGVEMLGGIIKPKYPLMLGDGTVVGRIQSIQEKNQAIDRAEKGQRIAVSIEGPTVGRQISEEDILFTSVPLEQLEQLEKDFEDKALLSEIRKIKEKNR